MQRTLLHKRWTFFAVISGLLALPAMAPRPLPAQEAEAEETGAQADDSSQDEDDSGADDRERPTGSTHPGGGSATGGGPGSGGSAEPAHAALLKDATRIDGLIPLYKKGNRVYAELNGSHYGSEFIVLISIARGIGREPILGGYTWQFGDDWVWQFRKVDDKVHVIRRNVRFHARSGSPEASAVRNAYTDSVLFSLPVAASGPGGGDLVDLTSVFMSDLPQISRFLPGFMFSAAKSTWASVKGFENNVQLQVAATYASGGMVEFDSVADSRGVTINVHYSVSRIPSTGFVPRLADDRVGYFVTVRKDYSKDDSRDQFVRYINRWNLQRPSGTSGDSPTPPREPIVFWIENTVPHRYRPVVRAGIEEWNLAFERAGWLDAIEVRQQPDDADWDPADINYNTFRWITADAGFAMGPTRVNPYTGEILDADIIFDASYLQFWKEEFETFDPQTIAAMTGGPLNARRDISEPADLLQLPPQLHHCYRSREMARQLAFGSAALYSRHTPEEAEELQEQLIMQGLKETVMHEVGHTLGLRHNFKGSGLLGLQELNAEEREGGIPIVASVMDYNPTNIVPSSWRQGDFYATTIGPYDYWAIEYGYKTLSGGTEGEHDKLLEIASRSSEPGLTYASDEEALAYNPDPGANTWDLGSDPLEYARAQAEVVQEALPGLVERLTEEGDDYSTARRAFNVLLAQHGRAMTFVARRVGGLHTSRSHRGDANAPASPLEPVAAEEQREALALLESQVFGDEAYDFPNELFGFLVSSYWTHWGMHGSPRKDYPLHDYILMWQSRVLDQLLSSSTLERMHDTELRVAAEEDVLTTAELLQRLTRSIFREVDTVENGEFTNRQPAISSLRRNLQREFLRRMSDLALGRTFAPDDCRTVAFAELAGLRQRIDLLLASEVELDVYSRAHLMEASNRIERMLEANVELYSF